MSTVVDENRKHLTNKVHRDNHIVAVIIQRSPMGAPVFARRARAYLGLKRRAKPILAFACGETEFSRKH
jgi:hypothetical protein